MWFNPSKYSKTAIVNVNEKMHQLHGELDDREARLTLVEFLRSNIGLTVELISGIKLAPYQEIALKGMMQRHRSMCVWGRGCAKCVSYSDSSVLEQAAGLIPLRELLPNLDFSLGEKWIDISPIKLWNGREWKTTNKVLLQPRQPSVRIKTRYGYELTGSINHPIKTINTKNKNCNIIWKKMSELVLGDFICISRMPIYFGQEVNQAAIDEGYLVGLLLGDGSMGNIENPISICSADEEILRFCEKYPCGVRRLDTRSSAISIGFNSVFMRQFMANYQLKAAYSYDKEIPDKILSNRALMKACLQGLFDTDGCCETQTPRVSFCSTSIKMAKQVQLALLTFGIVANLREESTKSSFGKAFKVLITDLQNLDIFYREIGFRLTRKQNVLKIHVKKLDSRNTNIDIIPGAKEATHGIKAKYRLPQNLSSEWRNKIRRKNNQKNLSYESLAQHIEFFEKAGMNQYDLQYLKDIQEEHFFFDKIESIEETTEDCLDFNIPDGERYWSNGFISHNSFMAAVFCFCQAIFEPNSKIMLAGPTFRTSRIIFSYLEKIVKSPGAELLMQAFGGPPSKRNDLFYWDINGGSISAIPLNGEKIRGFRANVIVIDEYLLMPPDIIENVLKPFLSSPLDIAERIRIRELEDKLIAEGLLTEDGRVQFDNTSKMVALSSASFTFENLYTTYMDWRSQIYSEQEDKEGCTYFISQLSYDALPIHMIDQTVAAEAKNGGASRAGFQREYCAQFVDESDGYFSAKRMHEVTLKDGEDPCTLVFGRPKAKYVISIDPSFSKSKASDFFSMSVAELNDEDKDGILVHGYAVAGGDLKDHIKYFFYLLTSFDVEMVIIDNAGYQFIEACNESVLFKEAGIYLGFFEVDTETEGVDYQKMLQKARASWNKEKGVICIKQNFTTEFIRKANQHLQACIDHKRIWFASNVRSNGPGWERAINTPVRSDLIPFDNVGELAEFQDDFVYQTKKQCSLIEVTSTAKGTQTFDLPQHLKRDASEKRARKDNYTTLLLANWLIKIYYEMKDVKVNQNRTFIPFFV